ncbi:MAG TPA: CNNM domain-containing protein [Edaphocola sp.]|nr:CNNM domain-containing protein [Edaphocola sp.]
MDFKQVEIIGASILLLIFLFFIILFAGLEFAYFGANRLSIELKRRQKEKSGVLLNSFFDAPERFWAATSISIFVCLIGFCLSLHVLSSSLMVLLPSVLQEFEYTQIFFDWILATIILVSMIGYFGKRIFESNPERSLMFWSGLMEVFINFTQPFAKFFVRFSEITLKYLFNIKVPKEQTIFERTDAQLFIRNSIQGLNNDDQINKNLFEKVIHLSQLKARKCLIPRNEIEAVELQTNLEKVMEAIVNSKQSKMIVYDKDIDHIVGYIHQIDIGKRPKSLKEILHSIPTIPETMNAIEIINLFTKDHKGIAWVVDEFGGTAGIITMEEILEEIFGDIDEDYDLKEYTSNQISPNTYMFSGRLKLEFIRKKYNLTIGEDETETLSGYIIRHYRTIPKQGVKIILDRYEFEILLATPTKIETVKVKVLQA